jgi:hypothetical protein
MESPVARPIAGFAIRPLVAAQLDRITRFGDSDNSRDRGRAGARGLDGELRLHAGQRARGHIRAQRAVRARYDGHAEQRRASGILV